MRRPSPARPTASPEPHDRTDDRADAPAVVRLPSRDLHATAHFYARLGFAAVAWGDAGLVLGRGGFRLAYVLSSARAPTGGGPQVVCLWTEDARALHAAFAQAGVPAAARAVPRLTPPAVLPWGFRGFDLIDPDGNRVRVLEALPARPAIPGRPW
jgi:catechol 2,3-dioxygenase-like lactoylglutathione lyase family enzyme